MGDDDDDERGREVERERRREASIHHQSIDSVQSSVLHCTLHRQTPSSTKWRNRAVLHFCTFRPKVQPRSDGVGKDATTTPPASFHSMMSDWLTVRLT